MTIVLFAIPLPINFFSIWQMRSTGYRMNDNAANCDSAHDSYYRFSGQAETSETLATLTALRPPKPHLCYSRPDPLYGLC